MALARRKARRRCHARRARAASRLAAFDRTLTDGALLRAAGLARGRDEHGGEGLFATLALSSGYALRLPRRMLLSASTAERSACGRALIAQGRAAGLPEFTGEEVRASRARRPFLSARLRPIFNSL